MIKRNNILDIIQDRI